MNLMNVLKNLKVIYWCVLGNKWHIVLPALKRQTKDVTQQYLPLQCPSAVIGKTSRVDQQCREMADEVAKLDLALKHPPPDCHGLRSRNDGTF